MLAEDALSSALMVRQLLDQSCPPGFLAQGILAQCPSANLVIFDQTKWPAGCLRGFVTIETQCRDATFYETAANPHKLTVYCEGMNSDTDTSTNTGAF